MSLPSFRQFIMAFANRCFASHIIRRKNEERQCNVGQLLGRHYWLSYFNTSKAFISVKITIFLFRVLLFWQKMFKIKTIYRYFSIKNIKFFWIEILFIRTSFEGVFNSKESLKWNLFVCHKILSNKVNFKPFVHLVGNSCQQKLQKIICHRLKKKH